MLFFTAIHSAESVLWFSAIIIATGRLTTMLRKGGVVKLLDRAMGSLFIGFGVRLALEKQR